ncbi:MAG: nucleotidyltransferase domain-containing protein [Anaerolineae bacterium]|jgi:hypothetical protein|nr:nucleotidyltransferase domain-containing protein [Anaerolineae bacterium]
MSKRHPHPHSLTIPHAEVAAFCRRWGIVRLALFGSALRPQDFRHDSDIDLLATFAPDSRHTLLDLVQMEGDLSDLFGRRVDLGEREAVEFDTNPARRQSILADQVVIYEA